MDIEKFPVFETFTDDALIVDNVIVKFGYDWCGPCKYISKNLEELSEIINKKRCKIYEVNCEKDYDSLHFYEVDAIPTIIFFKDGEERDRLIGYQQTSQIQQKINKIYKERT